MIRLKRVNNFLLTAIVVVNAYTILLPTWPALHFWWVKHFTHQQQALEVYTAPAAPTPQPAPKQAPIPKDNRVIIPKIALNDHLFEGSALWTVNKGVWLWYFGSRPDLGKNTVLIGHRFTYTQPEGVFYHLDLLKKGDKIAVYYQQKRYVYAVDHIEIVDPSDTHLTNPTKDPTLTLYTCTPLTTAKYRLFVIAKLVQGPA